MRQQERIQHDEVVNFRKKSSKSQDRERSCKEKIRYKTQTEAAQAALAYNLSIVVRFSDVRPYDCKYCVDWHIGHDNRSLYDEKTADMLLSLLDIVSILRPTPEQRVVSKQTILSQFSRNARTLNKVA